MSYLKEIIKKFTLLKIFNKFLRKLLESYLFVTSKALIKLNKFLSVYIFTYHYYLFKKFLNLMYFSVIFWTHWTFPTLQ